MKKIALIKHYQKLWFFTFNRFKAENYQQMREYFAKIVIAEIEEFQSLKHKKILDVGGGRGEFCQILAKKRQAEAINLDPNPDQKGLLDSKCLWPKTIKAVAQKIPFRDNYFDVVICRGVLEHIPLKNQLKSIKEMARVLKKGGLGYLMIPPWYNPHAGHILKPFHLLPFKVAKFLKTQIFKIPIKSNSLSQEALFPVTFQGALRMIKAADFQILAIIDTHFRLNFLTKIPLVREVAIPAVAFILRK